MDKKIMHVAIGTDHRGYELKKRLICFLQDHGYFVDDQGAFSEEAVDYPVIAHAVAKKVVNNETERGILFCGTGIGMSIAANKVYGARAALCHDSFSTTFSRRHNDANIFCFGVEIIKEHVVLELLLTWLTLDFDGKKEERHQRRVSQLELKGY